VPPKNAASPNLPETAEDIELELRTHETFLNQIHAEMNAGAVSKKRVDELWKTQRMITQLKVCTIPCFNCKLKAFSMRIAQIADV
jgi:RalA-binding protein 1